VTLLGVQRLKIAWITLLLGEGLKKLDQMILNKEKKEISVLVCTLQLHA